MGTTDHGRRQGMRTLRIIASLVLVNTVILWGIIGMNLDSTVNYPSRGLVAWTIINSFAAVITQVVSLCSTLEEG